MIERKERVSCKKGTPPKKTKEQLKKSSINLVCAYTYLQLQSVTSFGYEIPDGPRKKLQTTVIYDYIHPFFQLTVIAL